MNKNFTILKVIAIVACAGFLFYYFVGASERQLIQKAAKHQKYARYQRAIELYQKALTKNGKNPATYFNIAVCYYRLNDNNKAISTLYNAVKYKPDYFDAYFILGFIQAAEARYQQALESFNQAREIEPESQDVYLNIANVYNSIGKYDNAIHTYRKVIELSPDWFLPYYHVGVVYYSSGRLEEAVDAFERVAELNPYYTDTYSNLAVIFEEKGDLESALYYWKKRIDTAASRDNALSMVQSRYLQVLEAIKVHEKV